MTSFGLVLSSPKALLTWSPEPCRIAAWVHFKREWLEEADAPVFRHLIGYGCRYVLISGDNADEIEETIDYIASDLTNEIVLTVAKAAVSPKIGREFILTRCPDGAPGLVIMTAFCDNVIEETITFERMLSAVLPTIRLHSEYDFS